jgi:Ku C terminal domain like
MFPTFRRQYAKALEALQALREGAADTFDKAPGFNRALRDLAAAFESHPQHRAWWWVLYSHLHDIKLQL